MSPSLALLFKVKGLDLLMPKIAQRHTEFNFVKEHVAVNHCLEI